MGKDEEGQPSRGFKVSDRRRFVDGAEPAEEKRGAPAPEPVSAAAAEPQRPADGEPPPHEINFTTFVMGLSTQALMHLGEIPGPEAPHGSDLSAAKQMIDLLGVLRDKTTGNLEPAEDQLLSSMLYDLRMRYVEVSRKR
ncbi:MAG: DUF1844 domain-containing protein [Deltaproteobacteria bacterium]|nr:DUF1844 domain-containing protein [Deltaproteobacteria bacterium]